MYKFTCISRTALRPMLGFPCHVFSNKTYLNKPYTCPNRPLGQDATCTPYTTRSILTIYPDMPMSCPAQPKLFSQPRYLLSQALMFGQANSLRPYRCIITTQHEASILVCFITPSYIYGVNIQWKFKWKSRCPAIEPPPTSPSLRCQDLNLYLTAWLTAWQPH